MPALLTIEEAQALVLERVRPLAREQAPLAEAAGRVLAVPARAAVDLPPFPSSAMDGFALRAADAPGRLPIVARIAAGHPAGRSLGPGEAMAIATGGAVPDGADTVVPVEDVAVHGNEVDIPSVLAPEANIRPRGGDVRAGVAVVGSGVRLGPTQLGALAAAGVATVEVSRRPRVAVLVTGTELRPPGESLDAGEIYEANGVLLTAALGQTGALVELWPSVADEPGVHREAFRRALAVDVVVSSGGVSVGPHDLVRAVGAELGVEEVFWRVAVKPGKPIAFGVRGKTLVFGLPGNPVSSLVGFELFVRPALLALQGVADPLPVFAPGRLARAVRRNTARDELLRARAQVRGGHVELEPLGGQESHMIVRAAEANALALVPRGEGELPAGTTVRYLGI